MTRKPGGSGSSRHEREREGGVGVGGNTTPCCSKVGIKRGPWTAEEDEVLAGFVRKEGEGRWRTLPKRAGLLRCGKSCRLRWMNYLRPSVKRGHIAPDEEDLILRLHRLLGNRWSLIAGRIPGRTDNEIKNYWNTHLSKKLISQGIDPRTHKPFKPDTTAKASSSSCKTGEDQYRPKIIHSDRNNPKNAKQKSQPARPLINRELDHDFVKALSHGGGGTQTNATQVSNEAFTSCSLVNDDHQYQMVSTTTGKLANFHGYQNLILNSEGSDNNNNNNNIGFGTSSTIGDQTNLVVGNEDHDHGDDLNYCSDDMFSSFLNSLINEDAFIAPPHQNQLPNIHGNIAPFPSSADPFLSTNTAASNGWETAILSSDALDQINDSQRVDDPME